MNYVLLYLFFILISYITGIGEAYRIKDYVKYSLIWHNCRFFERVGILFTGIYMCSFMRGASISEYGLVIISLGIIFFIIYDGMINIKAFNRNFFYVSKTTTAFTEKFAHWWIKVPLLIIVTILNILSFRLLEDKDVDSKNRKNG